MVAESLFIVAPFIVCGGSVFDACFTLCPPSFAISLIGGEKAGCFTLSSWCL